MKKEAVTTESLLEIIYKKDIVIDEKDKTIAGLQERLDYMIRQKFASSSEKFPSNQPSLFEESAIEVEEDTVDEKITYTRKKRGNKKLPPESLPHIRVEHDLDTEDKVCECGCGLKRIKEISSKQYDAVPVEFRVMDSVSIIKDITQHFLDAHAIGGSIARAFAYLKNQLPKLSVYGEEGVLNII